jgi:hypothetical protein
MDVIYIAGPMTGYPQFNFPAFEEAAAVLRAQGMEVISPHELDSPEIKAAVKVSTDGKFGSDGKIGGETWGEILARDVKVVADSVSGVALLPNWHHSKGAKLEVVVALLGGKNLYQYHTGAGITPLDRIWVKDVLYANL